MEEHTLPDKTPRGTYPTWIRYGLTCMFLVLAVVRILDGGLSSPGWIADVLFSVILLIVVPRTKEETLSNYLGRPRTIAAVCLLLVAVGITIKFDLPRIWAQ